MPVPGRLLCNAQRSSLHMAVRSPTTLCCFPSSFLTRPIAQFAHNATTSLLLCRAAPFGSCECPALPCGKRTRGTPAKLIRRIASVDLVGGTTLMMLHCIDADSMWNLDVLDGTDRPVRPGQVHVSGQRQPGRCCILCSAVQKSLVL